MEHLSEGEDREDREKLYTLQLKRPCYFYGFKFDKKSNVMIDIGENQCALAMIIAKPGNLCQSTCQMEIIRKKPDWYECPLNPRKTEKNRGIIEKYSKKVRVFPKKFNPSDETPWPGMLLWKWIEHMDDIAG